MSNLAQLEKTVPLRSFSDLVAKIQPNGEISIYRQRRLKPAPVFRDELAQMHFEALALSVAVWGGVGVRVLWLASVAPWALGLSIHPNFDKTQSARPVYGQNGITSSGARTVRNAAFILQKEVGRRRLTFSTVTLPSLCTEDMLLLHESWGKAIELYRLGMSRLLRKKRLAGELVGVSEIQEKRYKGTGLPVLHAHFVFVGCDRPGRWAVSPKAHDRIWRKAIWAVLGRQVPVGKSCCNLQCVRKDAASYLGKYMSKGGSVIERVKEDGYEWWLPRQWFSCSRSLSQRLRKAVCIVSDGVELLLDLARGCGSLVWEWSREVIIELDDGGRIGVCFYGKLTEIGRQYFLSTYGQRRESV